MKKIATLLLAAGLVFGAATGASAIDFKAKGQWIMSFDYGQNGGFTGGNGMTGFNGKTGGRYANEDEFEAKQRVRLQLDAVASESLSGTVFFEMGDTTWGQAANSRGVAQGGALGADGTIVEVKNAYIDWIVPQTDLKFRMGIQGIALPSFTTGSNVFNDDVAGITASYQFNENVGLTAFWARPYNDNYVNANDHGGTRNNYLDNVDMFALLMPLTFDGVKVTPWVSYAAIGPNAFRNANGYFSNVTGANNAFPTAGMMALGGARHKSGAASTKAMGTYGNAVWAGLTGEMTTFDPFRLAWDFNYGSVSYADSRANRAGWLGSLLFEYKLDWAIPGLYTWYASGDDGNPANGSERMPSLSTSSTDNGFSDFAFSGGKGLGRESLVSYDMTGTWGVGVRLKDMSFIENLKHTVRLNVMGGTNSTTMTRYLAPHNGAYQRFAGATGPNSAGAVAGASPLYLTTNDTAMEIGMSNEYKMYDNFSVFLDASYISLWLDKSRSVWGNSRMNGRSDQERDPWNVDLRFVYSF